MSEFPDFLVGFAMQKKTVGETVSNAPCWGRKTRFHLGT